MDIQKKLPERQKECDEKIRQSRADLLSTSFYQKKILHYFNAKNYANYHKELRTPSLDFFNHQLDEESLSSKVKAQIDSLSESLGELQKKAKEEEEVNGYLPGSRPPGGYYSQAIHQYEALLEVHRAIQEANEQVANEQKGFDMARTDAIKALLELHQAIQEVIEPKATDTARADAIAALSQKKEDIGKSYKGFLRQYASKTEYNPINKIYRETLKLHDIQVKSLDTLTDLNEYINTYKVHYNKIVAHQCTDTEMKDFQDKMQTYIRALMFTVSHATQDRIKVNAIIDYYYSLAKQPFQDQISKKQTERASIRGDLTQIKVQITKQKSQKTALESELQKRQKGELQKLSGEVSDHSKGAKLEKLRQQQRDLQKEVSRLTDQLNTYRHKQDLGTLLGRSTLTTSSVLDRIDITEDNRTAYLEIPIVRHYTDRLSRIYQSTYGKEGKEADIDSKQVKRKLMNKHI